MKKQKIKKILKGNLLISLFSFMFLGVVFGAFISNVINPQFATNIGSNSSQISFTGSVGNEAYYVNNEDNSAIIGNYLTGYYYDSLFGFFKLDWSVNSYENVRFMDSTSLCSTGYGYKIGGKAYSEVSGYINFNHDLTTFVYYCIDDGKLYGTAYGKYIGYQDFEGIQISILTNVNLVDDNSNSIFSNDDTNINNSNGVNGYGGNIDQLDITKESIFYIIK